VAKLRLARYSQQLMDELVAREGLQYWQTHTGVLYLFREEADLRTAERNSRLLAEHAPTPARC
jgi:D-amino-acid dehydrogenase